MDCGCIYISTTTIHTTDHQILQTGKQTEPDGVANEHIEVLPRNYILST